MIIHSQIMGKINCFQFSLGHVSFFRIFGSRVLSWSSPSLRDRFSWGGRLWRNCGFSLYGVVGGGSRHRRFSSDSHGQRNFDTGSRSGRVIYSENLLGRVWRSKKGRGFLNIEGGGGGSILAGPTCVDPECVITNTFPTSKGFSVDSLCHLVLLCREKDFRELSELSKSWESVESVDSESCLSSTGFPDRVSTPLYSFLSLYLNLYW